MRIRQFQIDEENNINAKRCVAVIDVQLVDNSPTLWAFCADEGEGTWADQQFYALQTDHAVSLNDIKDEFVKPLINQDVAWFFFHIKQAKPTIIDEVNGLEQPGEFNGHLS